MNIKAIERQPVLELAKQERDVGASLKPDWFERLAEAGGPISEVSCEVQFRLDGHGRPKVTGSAQAKLNLVCQRCETPVPRELELTFAVTLVSESQAQQAQVEERAVDLRIIDDGRFGLVELIEDELLLALTSQVCVDADCENAPSMSYPAVANNAEEAAALENAKVQESPFAVLAQLKSSRTE